MAGTNCEYTQLAQACREGGINKRLVNMFAVVTHVGEPRESRGTDRVCKFQVCDPLSEGDDGADVDLVCFARAYEMLPRPAALGDIVLLYGVAAGLHCERPQLTANLNPLPPGHRQAPVPRRPVTYFSLYHAGDDSLEPYQTSLPGGGALDPASPDAQLLASLRALLSAASRVRQHRANGGGPEAAGVAGPAAAFVPGALPHAPPLQSAARPSLQPETLPDAQDPYRRTIHSLQPGGFGNVAGRVLCVSPTASPSVDVVWLWDGTDARPRPQSEQRLPVKLGAVRGEEGVLQQHCMPLGEAREGAGDAMPSNGARPTTHASPLPELGTAMPILFSRPELPRPRAGDWIKLTKLQSLVVAGQIQGHTAAITTWAPSAAAQAEVEAAYAARVGMGALGASEWAEEGELLARVDWGGVGECPGASAAPPSITSLRRVLVDACDPRPRSYRVLLQVKEVGGLAHADFRAYHPDLSLALEVRVADATAQLVATLSTVAGRALLGARAGPPGESGPVLLEAFERLLGAGCASPAGPWIEACLRSVALDPAQPALTRRFFITHTVLTGA